jgi:hypothetical protein
MSLLVSFACTLWTTWHRGGPAVAATLYYILFAAKQAVTLLKVQIAI